MECVPALVVTLDQTAVTVTLATTEIPVMDCAKVGLLYTTGLYIHLCTIVSIDVHAGGNIVST